MEVKEATGIVAKYYEGEGVFRRAESVIHRPAIRISGSGLPVEMLPARRNTPSPLYFVPIKGAAFETTPGITINFPQAKLVLRTRLLFQSGRSCCSGKHCASV